MSRFAVLLLLLAIGCRAPDFRPVPPDASVAITPAVVAAPAVNNSQVATVAFESSITPGDALPEPQTAPRPLIMGEPVETPAPDSMSLTLTMLEEIALGNNPTIAQAAALVQQQEGIMVQAGLYPNPQLGYVRTDADQAGQSQTSGVFIGQELVTAHKLRLAQQEAGQEIDLRSWQLNAQEMRVLNDVRVRFYEILGAQQAMTAAEELQKSAEEGVDIARKLLEARQGGRPDLLQAEMQLSLAKGAVKDAKFRLDAARRQLANVAGIPELPSGSVVGSLDDDVPELDWDSTLARLLGSSPLLRSQEAELRAAQTEVQLARAQAIPNVSVQVVAERDHIQKFSSVSTFVAIPVPIFNRNQGNIANTQGVLAQQQQEYERLHLALADQLAASFRQYCSLRSEAMRVRQELLPRAKENLELTSEAYRFGRMDFLRVVDARRSYFEAKMSEIDALTELHKVASEIEGLQLTGALNPTEVGTALQTAGGGAGTRNVLLKQLQEQRGGATRNLPGVIQAGD